MNLITMENAEEIYHLLEDFSNRKPKPIPQELNDYLSYVARTGDPVYQWNIVKSLFKEKLLTVITDFYETSPGIDIPHYPNVDPFNFDVMRNSLLERLDAFSSAPFTVQRICELLTCPRKQYNRIDKYMRAIEKNILVVSTREPGIQRHPEPDNGEPIEPVVNGSDNNSDYNVDVEMDDMSWKENSESTQSAEPQPSSSGPHTSVENLESRLHTDDEASMEIQEKITSQYESVTPPETSISIDEQMTEKPLSDPLEVTEQPSENVSPCENLNTSTQAKDTEPEQNNIKTSVTLNVPEIKIDNTEITEQRILEEKAREDQDMEIKQAQIMETKQAQAESSSDENQQMPVNEEPPPTSSDESSSNSSIKDDTEIKPVAEVLTSSEESSSSSDNTESNSNSPKHEVEIKNPVLESDPRESVVAPEEQVQENLNKDIEVQESAQSMEKVLEEPAKFETSLTENVESSEISEKAEKDESVSADESISNKSEPPMSDESEPPMSSESEPPISHESEPPMSNESESPMSNECERAISNESEPPTSNETDMASGDFEAKNKELSKDIADLEQKSEMLEANTSEIQSSEISEAKTDSVN